jgi:hypothetical protein
MLILYAIRERAAAQVLVPTPYATREVLSDRRSLIVESGESPPGRGRLLDAMITADADVRNTLPAIIGRCRSSGVLTWAMLYQIEAEVMAQLAATGKHKEGVLDLIRTPAK